MLSSVQVAATRRFAEEKAPAPTFHSGQSSQLADSLRLPRATDYISITPAISARTAFPNQSASSVLCRDSRRQPPRLLPILMRAKM
jgi:hypothetical protein